METNDLKKKQDNYNYFFSMDELVGKRFGHWTVLSECNYRTKGGNKIKAYNCVCDCGTKRVVLKQSLLRGVSQSCGCFRKDKIREEAIKNPYSPLNQRRLYNIYDNMISRCYNTHVTNYNRYGNKGIDVCTEWRGEKGRENFMYWALSNGYEDSLTLDRIDNSRGYSPDNCRWVDVFIQANNKSNNKHIEIDGVTHTLAEWSRISGIPVDTIGARINYFGYSNKDAVFSPLRKIRNERHTTSR